jgi:SAM-dependent methyltransferase
VMDMSFANQALAAEYVVQNAGTLERKVYPVSEEIDKEIARLKLETMGVGIDTLTEEQAKYLDSWDEGTWELPYRLQLDLSLAGVALARNWLVGEREEVEGIAEEIRRLTAEPLGEWEDVPLRGAGEGYAEWAATYDATGNPILQLEGPFVAGLLSKLEPGVALDAACGTGRHAAVLAGMGHRVVGVDSSAAMLEQARRRLPEAELRQGQLQALPLDAEAVDLAVCSLALTHLADPAPAIAELARVVRPGGHIVLTDVHPCFVSFGAQAFYRGEDERPGYVRNHVHWHETYLRAFQGAGLDVLACHDLAYRTDEFDLWVGRLQVTRDVVVKALVGLPAVLAWELART